MRKSLIRHISLENEIPVGAFVFLGGTTNETNWRDDVISKLNVKYFNPIVEDWTNACIKEEEIAKINAKSLLYVITPKQTGTYSLVELAVSACLNRDKQVVIVFLKKDEGESFDEAQLKSNEAVKKLLESHTNAVFYTKLEDAAEAINSYLAAFN